MMGNIDEKKAGVPILISDKIDQNKGNDQRKRRTLYNGKKVNLLRRHSNPKYVCTTKYGKQKLIEMKEEIDN